MSRGPHAFRQGDVQRLVKAAAKAGLRVSGIRVDVSNGTITVETGDGPKQDSSALDQWMAKRARQTEGH